MIGILQGRLTLPTNNQLQCFPTSGWETEFELARECGLECIELLQEKHYNPLNPLYSSDGISKLRKLSKETGIKITSICSDYFMERPIHSEDMNCRKESAEMLRQLIGICSSLEAKTIVLPFFEKAEVKTSLDRQRLAAALVALSPLAADHGIKLALELTLPGEELKKFIGHLPAKGISICYDTGNTTGVGHDIARDIRLLGWWITHVHLKDRRRSDYANVLLGTGSTDFKGAFSAFKDINYSGPMILETFRGDNPVETAKNHAEFIRNFL